ncbi:MAG: hypothetical protein KKI08_00745 [Armatimonadetes bacterium]|nr:hypothetical protein [Armatimonadota bacterium]
MSTTAQQTQQSGLVKVLSGMNEAMVPGVAGKPLQDCVEQLRGEVGAPATAAPFVDEVRRDGTYVIAANQTVEFISPVGVKGAV